MTESTKTIFSTILSPIIVAVIVGLTSSFLMATTMLTKLETDLVRAKEDIKDIYVNVNEIKRQREDDRESFIRLETKIDILLQEQRRRQSSTPIRE